MQRYRVAALGASSDTFDTVGKGRNVLGERVAGRYDRTSLYASTRRPQDYDISVLEQRWHGALPNGRRRSAEQSPTDKRDEGYEKESYCTTNAPSRWSPRHYVVNGSALRAVSASR